MRLSFSLASNTGSLLALAGCTKSGKTEELHSIASVCNALRVGFQLFAYSPPPTENKQGNTELTDSAGPWTSRAELVHSASGIDSAVRRGIRVVMIDDLHLFTSEILPVVQSLIRQGIIVVAAGRDTAHNGQPYSCVGEILASADQVMKFHALCDSCGSDASFTVKVENNRESPRCRRCRGS